LYCVWKFSRNRLASLQSRQTSHVKLPSFWVSTKNRLTVMNYRMVTDYDFLLLWVLASARVTLDIWACFCSSCCDISSLRWWIVSLPWCIGRMSRKLNEYWHMWILGFKNLGF